MPLSRTPRRARLAASGRARSSVAPTRRAALAVLLASLTTGGVLALASSTAPAAPKPPPPKVTQQQVTDAAALKTQIAAKVGALSGQIAKAQAQLAEMVGRQELAEQKVALTVTELRAARSAASAAKGRAAAAQTGVDKAHTAFVQYLQASYMSGDVAGITGSLLTARDPGALLDRGTIEEYAADSQVTAIDELQRATVARSNAEAAARRAVRSVADKAKAARKAKAAADDAVAIEKAQRDTLTKSMATSQAQLNAAQLQLATLNNQRAVYVQYQQALARKREQERLAKIAAQEAAQQAARNRQRQHGSGPIVSGPAPPAGGTWTAAKGERAVERAMDVLGTPYAWAGGGAGGPSYGVCDAGNGAPNDCNVDGFDCSGLAMYAWGKGWAHYAATQFTQVGSYHPSADNLRPGDLIFWSYDGSISGIHHVAIYKGGGRIIEAPYSGGYVQTADLYEYGSFFGATRPLS